MVCWLGRKGFDRTWSSHGLRSLDSPGSAMACTSRATPAAWLQSAIFCIASATDP
jgi:hypothetical protein